MGTIEWPVVQQNILLTTTQPTIKVALTCAYCQQVGHEFKNYPFVGDKLKRLMREEFITYLQPMVPSTPLTHVGDLYNNPVYNWVWLPTPYWVVNI